MQQQSTNITQNEIMTTPPVMVTVKDSLYFTDMLSWNLLAMKKAHFYAQNAQDPAIKAQIEKCGQMHQRHYERILQHFNDNSQASMQN